MKLLVFDTSFSACSVAVIDAPERANTQSANVDAVSEGHCHTNSLVAASFEPMETGQAVRLMPMIEEVMSRASVSFNDLDGIATSPGPGTFTGVRIAVATARALALSTSLPIFGFSSLALLAAKAHQTIAETCAGHLIAATMDARRDAIYLQIFANPKDPPRTKPKLIGSDGAVDHVPPSTIVVGTGVTAFQETADLARRSIFLQLEDLQPDATYATGIHMEQANPLRPLYLRPPDAKPQVGKSIPRVSQ